MKNPKLIRVIAIVVVLAISYFAKDSIDLGSLTKPKSTSNGPTVESLFESKTSDTVIEVSGRVKAVLKDDLEGSKHQKFILKFSSGHTVLVSHNIDLAPRVPLGVGDDIELRGEYEWTEKGGVIHWTHHDPGNRRPGGWIKLKGKTYK